ncbi:hypothetical protein H0H92_005799 [Tricholoma furcatifolium]|nr:hypothetical protein H0H92_005799 [Tricholoma furcatifolium]
MQLLQLYMNSVAQDELTRTSTCSCNYFTYLDSVAQDELNSPSTLAQDLICHASRPQEPPPARATTSTVSASPLAQVTSTPNSSGSPVHLVRPVDPGPQKEQQTISATQQGRVCGNKACQWKIWACVTGSMRESVGETGQLGPSKFVRAISLVGNAVAVSAGKTS